MKKKFNYLFKGCINHNRLCQTLICSLMIVFFLITFYYRYASNLSGFPSQEWDYGSHIAIINYILEGNFFPEFHKTQQSIHSIANWLPVYHGIVGAHLPVAVLFKLGISIPKAMLIISDLSLILIFVSMNFLSGKWPLKLSIFLFLIVPSYSVMASQGFYSLIVGSALAFSGLVLFMKNYRKSSFIIFAYAFFCYPDFSIWLFGHGAWFLLKMKNKNNIQKAAALALLLIAAALYIVLLNRSLLLYGSITWPLTYIFSLSLLIGHMTYYDRKRLSEYVPQLTVYFLTTTLILIIAPIIIFQEITVEYYTKKYTYWSIYFILILLLEFRWPKLLIITTMVTLLYGGLSEHRLYYSSFLNLLSATSGFTPLDDSELRKIKQYGQCKNYFYIPARTTSPNYVKSIATYAYLGKYDVYNWKILDNNSLIESEDKLSNLTEKYSIGNKSDDAIQELIKTIIQKNIDICLVVAKDRKKFLETIATNLVRDNQNNLLYKLIKK